MTNSIYRFQLPNANSFVAEDQGWESPSLFNLPQMNMTMTNRMQAFVLDTANQHIIDYVQFAGPNRNVNLNSLFETNVTGSSYANMFSTALDNNQVPWGIDSQIYISEGNDYNDTTHWPKSDLKDDEIRGFSRFMGVTPFLSDSYNSISISNYFATNLTVQVPFTPTITIYDYTPWEANDPLVHTLASDLYYYDSGNPWQSGFHPMGFLQYTTNAIASIADIGNISKRFKPWYFDTSDQQAGNDIRYKDSLIPQSDFWDFPANKLPTVGWLGRVHRGTPWQTVYLKAADILLQTDTVNDVIGTNTWATGSATRTPMTP